MGGFSQGRCVCGCVCACTCVCVCLGVGGGGSCTPGDVGVGLYAMSV